MAGYYKRMGRFEIDVNENGLRMHDYSHGAQIKCLDGWNDSCPTASLTASVEELRDLRYLLDRAIAHAESPLK